MTGPLDKYLRHKQLYGTELVYECAHGLTDDEMVRLRVELDAIDRQSKRRPRPVGRRPASKSFAPSCCASTLRAPEARWRSP